MLSAAALSSALMAVLLAFGWERELSGGILGFPLDDGWIHAAYARNLVEGEFWSYGNHPTSTACTSPLWVFVLFLPYAFGLRGVTAAVAATLPMLAALALVMAALARRLNLGFDVQLLVAATTPIIPPIMHSAVSGMETLLSVLLVWLCLLFTSSGSFLLAAGAAGLSLWARPDYSLFAALWWLFFVPGRRKLLAGFVLAAFAAAFAAFHIALWGKPLPATFYAKVSDEGLLWALRAGNAKEALQALLFYPVRGTVSALGAFFPHVPAMILPAAYGAWMLGRRGKAQTKRFWKRLLAVALAYVVLRAVLVAPSAIQWGRYIAWVFPAFMLWCCAGILLSRNRLLASATLAAAVIACAAAPLWAQKLGDMILSASIMMPGKQMLFGWSHFPHLLTLVPLLCASAMALWLLPSRALRGAALAAVVVVAATGAAFSIGLDVHKINGLQVRSARWCAANLPPGTRLLVHDIGAPGYFAPKLFVVDVLGLLVPELLEACGGAKPRKIAAKCKHEYFLTFPVCDPGKLGLEREYERVISWSVANPTVGTDSTITLFRHLAGEGAERLPLEAKRTKR